MHKWEFGSGLCPPGTLLPKNFQFQSGCDCNRANRIQVGCGGACGLSRGKKGVGANPTVRDCEMKREDTAGLPIASSSLLEYVLALGASLPMVSELLLCPYTDLLLTSSTGFFSIANSVVLMVTLALVSGVRLLASILYPIHSPSAKCCQLRPC